MVPSPEQQHFDPLTQNVTFLGPDGRTPIGVPIPALDALDDVSISVTLNYGIQAGACLAMLLAVLAVTTPAAKLRRPSALLHVLALATVVVRNGLLVAYYLSPVAHFYQLHSGDFSSVPRSCLYASVAGNVVSLALVVVVEAALMNQAWAMVTLWPDPAKYGLAAASLLVTLLTAGFRLAFTVIQNQAVLDLTPPLAFAWVVHGAVVTNALSIFWFCALFNLKLVMHLVRNRGILPSTKTLTSMEMLVMTNGVLMVVPVVFAGLEWGTFQNFEAGSLTLTSVALILPLGTMAAQQISLRNASPGNSNNLAYYPNSRSAGSSGLRNVGSATTTITTTLSSALPAFKIPSMTTSCGSGPATRRGSVLSKAERGGKGVAAPPVDHFDFELRQIDSTSALAEERDQGRHDETF
ncbi:Uncharacterized protein TCAP_05984 [Tolypocladium capitatum]|uniref:Pheromone alpha factor receptor n=1 Tax=Tolypocladium capitatum TaxID=45235 RepID=A0A2K3Q937_9HYPO|nr:Uncharacterized protein TCAP_05984 [Tolypocladium capitatum]